MIGMMHGKYMNGLGEDDKYNEKEGEWRDMKNKKKEEDNEEEEDDEQET